MAPIAAHAAGAGVAMAAFGAAVIPQISNLSDAAKAQDKYTQAVQQYGAHSKQAVQAQQQAAQVFAGMPRATQQAAAAYSNLRDQFKGFSDSTAKFTMVPVEHSFAVLGAIIPKLTPMVEGTSTQLDRLMKVAGGAVSTGGFDSLSKKVSDFANNSLKSAVDGAIHFMRVMSEGNASGPMTEFMAYAKAQGPAVKELLSNLMQALGNIAKGAAQAGPGLLTIVNAMAKLVAAVPPGLIGNLMQVYAAFKLIKLAGAGIGAVAGGIQTLAARITALRAASVAAGGGLAGLRAAFIGLGAATKATVIIAGIAAAIAVIGKLSSLGKSAPPDVDKLSSSLARLGSTGKVTGEAASKFGTHFEKLKSQMDKVLDPSVAESINNWGHSISGGMLKGGDATEELTGSFKAIDESLAGLVKGGKAKLAAAALKDMFKHMNPEQVKKLKESIDGYKSALADQALEAKLTAESQGLFGTAAQETAAKLDQQKASADGLRGAIQALNDVNRQGLGGMIGFEAAVDAAAKAAKDNAGALSMSGGVLNLNSEKARNAASALQDLADKTDSAAAANRESTGSWEGAIAIYQRGRSQLIKNAQAMGLTKSEAAQLADQILKIPDKTARVKMNTEDARAGLNAFNAAVKRSPGSKSVTLKTLSKSAEQILEAFGYKVTHLKNGKVKVTAATGGALSGIQNVSSALAALDGKTATTTINSIHNVITNSKTYRSVHDIVGKASGGLVRGYAGGGDVQSFPDGGFVQGPGSGTSDSILGYMGSGAVAAVSNTEYVMKAAAVRKYGVKMMDALNEGRLPIARLARGGVTKAEREARAQARGDLTISHFGQMAGYQRSEFGSALGKPDSISSLVNALNQWRATILKATHGATENRLLKQLDSTGKQLLKYEKQLGSVTKSLEKARDKLNSLKDAASQLASSVKGNILSSANITRGASGEGTVTVASIMGGLTQSRDKATAFADALKQLKGKGLSSSLIQQIAEAGIEGGGLESAGALLGASGSEIQSLNNLQGQISKAAGAAGKATADAVYGAQIKAQQKLVNDLAAQQKKLTSAMDKLTKAMEKAIKSAFGKKASGGIVGAAASGGMRSGLTLVGEYEPELLQLPAGARVWSGPDTRRKLAAAQAPWPSMLTAPRRAPHPAAAGAAPVAGDGQPIVIQVRIGERDFGELWVDTGRRAVKTRGSIEATLRPPRR
ncbi:phage tail protein [Streptomyces sp. YIM S03343]